MQVRVCGGVQSVQCGVLGFICAKMNSCSQSIRLSRLPYIP